MSGHITPPQFDPHAEAIDGAPADPWPVDARLRDDRVKAARQAEWDEPKQWPAVDDSHNPPARPVRVDSLPVQPVPVPPSRSIGEVASVLAFGIVCFVLGTGAGWAMAVMVVAR